MQNKPNSKLKKLFLIDGLGALLSIFFLSVVLTYYESVFGIPKSTLYFLAFWPFLFVLYDLYCYYKMENKAGLFLKGIAYANITYCILSIATAFYHSSTITHFGWMYIVLEIFIVIILVKIELKVAKDQTPN
ncbi:hypothetical protein N9176_00315 [bacterium]|nr:hypothetical protein [bacterium]